MLKQFFISIWNIKLHAAAVAAGGALGALARYGVCSAIANQILAVLVCNICGSFILAAAIELRAKIRREFENLVSVGFCGGLSIFASFSKDSVMALRNADFALFFINLSANFILCVCAIFAAQFAVEKLRYILAYLHDTGNGGEKISTANRIIAAIKHAISKPKIEVIPTAVQNLPTPPTQAATTPARQASAATTPAQSPSAQAEMPSATHNINLAQTKLTSAAQSIAQPAPFTDPAKTKTYPVQTGSTHTRQDFLPAQKGTPSAQAEIQPEPPPSKATPQPPVYISGKIFCAPTERKDI